MPTLSRRLLWPLAILLLVLGRSSAVADLYYLGQRIPDIQKPWDSHGYQVLIDVLKKIEGTQKNVLSRRSGEFTGPLYLRVVSEESFRPWLNICGPLEIHQNEAREVLFKLKELVRLYFDLRAAKQSYGAEALGPMSYSLCEQSILFTLIVEFWMTLSQAEQRNPARLQGMQEAKAVAAMLTGSALDYLGLITQFERQDLVLHSAELAKEMPELFIHLPSLVRAQSLERIAGFARDRPYPEIRDNMHDLQPVLQAIQADVEKQLVPGRNAKTPDRPLDLSPPPEGKPNGVNGL